jgi:phage terminase small subunit
MTPRQLRFVEEYARLRQGRKAALAAGYAQSCADAMASRSLRSPAVVEALVALGVPLAFQAQPQTHRRVMPFLTERQQRFVEHYLILGNGAEAARRAGYSRRSALGIASYLLRRPQIEAAIAAANEERAARTRISRERVLKEWARLGFADPAAILDSAADGSLSLKPLDAVAADDRAAIAAISVATGKNGSRLSLRLFDKPRALAALGRHLGLDKEAAPEPADPAAAQRWRDELRAKLLRLAPARPEKKEE